jgi:hypothetical protein
MAEKEKDKDFFGLQSRQTIENAQFGKANPRKSKPFSWPDLVLLWPVCRGWVWLLKLQPT